MTKEEKLAVLEAAEVRAYGAVASTEGTDMGAEGFLTLLHSIEQLAWAQERLKHPGIPDPFDVTPPADIGGAHEVAGETDATETEEKPVAQTAKEPAEPGPEAPTKEQVRAQLARYQANDNLDIPALMKSMGYSKLSEIPAAQYTDLLERARKWADGEG